MKCITVIISLLITVGPRYMALNNLIVNKARKRVFFEGGQKLHCLTLFSNGV